MARPTTEVRPGDRPATPVPLALSLALALAGFGPTALEGEAGMLIRPGSTRGWGEHENKACTLLTALGVSENASTVERDQSVVNQCLRAGMLLHVRLQWFMTDAYLQ